MKRLTTEEFINRAREVHGDKYDYSKTEYVNNHTKVCIICPEHGEFWQVPSSHLRGIGCGRCGGTGCLTTEEFIKRAKEVHGNKYDYSECIYSTAHGMVTIICPIHGKFRQIAHNHLHGATCPKCANRERGTTEEFIEKARKIHGDKYDYSKVEYVNAYTKVCIICPEHGEFWQTPNGHLNGNGCPVCAHTDNWDTRGRTTTEEFIRKVEEVHGDKYDLSLVKYSNSRSKVEVICHKINNRTGEEHGKFEIVANSLLNGRGCPKCRNSKLQIKVESFLRKKNITFKSEYSWEWLKFKSNGRLHVDLYIPEYNTVIECQGIQHYIPLRYGKQKQEDADMLFELRQTRDKIKKKLCEKNGVKIVYFTEKGIYDKWVNDKTNLFYDLEEMLNFIKNG